MVDEDIGGFATALTHKVGRPSNVGEDGEARVELVDSCHEIL